MKSSLSHIMPAWKACQILGDDTVARFVRSLLEILSRTKSYQHQHGPIPQPTDENIEALVYGLSYRHPPPKYPDTPLPESVASAWKQWQSLVLDKQTLLRWLLPTQIMPHAGPSGHMGLFDCWIYALQGHGTSSKSTAIAGGSTGGGPSPTNNTNAASWLIYVPDVIILLAICKQYSDERQLPFPVFKDKSFDEEAEAETEAKAGVENEKEDGAEDGSEGDKEVDAEADVDADAKDADKEHSSKKTPPAPPRDEDAEHKARIRYEKSIWVMSLLAFRIYDAYQKKGVVARDTVHRFLTDVYGEDSYKEEATIQLLDVIFDTLPKSRRRAKIGDGNNEHDGEDDVDEDDEEEDDENIPESHRPQRPQAFAKNLHATVGEGDFCRRVLDTLPDYDGAEYVVLDWMSTLACRLLPPPHIPDSVSAFLSALYSKPLPLCQLYGLPEHRLYEIKRRFHSLVSSSSPVVMQGDPMDDATTDSSQQQEQQQSRGLSDSNHGSIPKQAISQAALVDALCKPNDEMGSGGYLPPSLARLLFWNGCHRDSTYSHLNTNVSTSKSADPNNKNNTNSGPEGYWGLYHVLHFGCIAVRRNLQEAGNIKVKNPVVKSSKSKLNPNAALLRFVFGMFQWTTLILDVTSNQNIDDIDEMDRTILSRNQVAHMIVQLLEFADFRRSADRPVDNLDDSDSDEGPSIVIMDPGSNPNMEEWLVEEDAAMLFGMVPKKLKNSGDRVKKIDGRTGSFVRLRALVDDALQASVTPNQMTFEEFCNWGDATLSDDAPPRLSTLLLELRLIASVLFGIPPTEASMEVRLIGEIEARHKERYPQSDVSRRGPRGTVWFLIDSDWLKQWAIAVKRASKMPNQDVMNSKGNRGLDRINNTGLLAEDGSLALRSDIRWKYDYEILPPLAYSGLQAWYDGGPPIWRSVVRYISTHSSSPHSSVGSRPRIPTENELELYPFFVTVYLCDASSRGEARPFQQNYQLSRVSPVLVMLVQLCKELDVAPEQARLWVLEYPPQPMTNVAGAGGGALVKSGELQSPSRASQGTAAGSTLASHSDDWILSLEHNIVEQRKRRNISSDRPITLLLELKDPESNLWPRGVDGKEWNFNKEKTEVEKHESDLGDGIVGLYNMGNTCYLNSPIQCLSHTPIFREYFTSKYYLKDINKTNPIGYGGQLAQVSAVLINSLWKRFNNQNNPQPVNRVKAPGSYALVSAPSLTPKTFKDSLGKFNEHFQGNEQHDAHELLAFLLAGLSEDLNRVVEKPYIEAPDSDGRPDQELADIWWSNHLKREMSVIVALFTGQYKSLLTCRTCNYESARFEPFTFIQLPLPEDDYLPVSLILYPVKDGVPTTKYCVRVRADGRLRDVLVALAKVLHADDVAEKRGPQSPSRSYMAGNTEDDEKMSEEFFGQLATNLAVVDMREGYISKIAPNSWSLQDLQNKETGELPLLHVYQLDPIPDDDNAKTPKKLGSENGVANEDEGEEEDYEADEVGKKAKRGFLAVSQRRSEVISQEYLHPFTHRVFGTPLLLRIDDLDKRTGRELYDLIALRLRNFVPKGALRFLQSKKDRNSESDQNGEDENKKSGRLTKRNPGSNRTTTDMEEVSAGSVPRYGFRLRLTTRDGRRCLTCPWYDCCIGCYIPDDDSPTIAMDGDSLVVDWHFAVDLATSGFGTRSNTMDPIAGQSPASRPKMYSNPVKNHASCASGQKKSGHGGAITLEDCLDAFAKEERIPEAYCSKCKDFRVQTKRMSLWRLPPVVVIHLKRFQFTQHMRRKLRDLVVFPIEGLDLSRIMATDTEHPESISPKSGTDENEIEASPKSPTKDNGRDKMLYDLYGVVHHQGALSGGHYVASLKSEFDGQWRLFNDAQIYEIHSRDVVDASAYILFYIRRDAAKAKLSDFWDVSAEGGVSEEDMEKLVKGRSERCTIS